VIHGLPSSFDPMKNAQLKKSMLANAEEIRRLHTRIHETVRLRERSAEDRQQWLQACREFHTRYDALAFPGSYGDAFERMAAGEPEAIEAALVFLEVRPYFFRSGYMYKDLLRKTKRVPRSGSQARRYALIA
jgi:hypothetical protein